MKVLPPLLAVLCAAAPALRPAALHAAEVKALKTETRSVSLSLDGSSDRYGDSLGEELRAGLEWECASELKLGGLAFDWSLDLYYDYSRSETSGEASTANSLGLDIAKLLLSRWRGAEPAGLQPYLLAGAEFTRLRERDAEDEPRNSRFLSPTAGFGAEYKLTDRVGLKAEYRTNFSGGPRRLSGLTLGFSYAFFAAEEEEEEAPEGASRLP
ncbi:MAG TPA: outer membrane beta-barrel protein [Elusimicrobiales bacterium]|nr:outer membrane beta-barrel protein [Elusimicrobiales bacterium]